LGYIGSHVVISLLKKGYEVTLIDSLINSNLETLEKIKNIVKIESPAFENKVEFAMGDIRDPKFLEIVFEKARSTKNYDAVMHFAGLKSVEESLEKPIKYWDFNVGGSLNLIKFMDKYDCRTLIFSSSATIYGCYEGVPFSEESKINPLNPYAKTKAYIEKLNNDLYKTNKKWRISNLRYFNPIGYHPSGILKENPLDDDQNIFPIICKVAKGYKNEIQIFGNDWDTRDGTCMRDYIHIMDLSEGHLLALEYLFSCEKILLNLNLGRGEAITVLELINTFEKVNKVKIVKKFSKKRNGDVAILVADVSFAKKLLNWQAKMSLAQMCIDGWKGQLNIS
ncbi:UDP-glucose 4-epimerase GalE, partial [Prochlorococcus sp. AH-716-M18]|nr:UDP-glucose 4-epimerase GalE [Prochlorococcus sp. AH-716-M18]